MENQENATLPPRPASEIARDIARCTRCHLHRTRRNAVPGAGPDRCRLMLIGEGPGEHEDREGQPFVGPSGKELDKMMRKSGIERSEIYITNVVKCRPPDNRTPTPEEVQACRPWLAEQIQSLEPKLIITMGAPATHWFKPNVKITQARGRVEKVQGQVILPVLHTAYAMRRPKMAQTIEGDFVSAAQWLEILDIDPDRPNPYPADPEPGPAPSKQAPAAPEPAVRALPANQSRRGPVLEAAEWVRRQMQQIPEVDSRSGAPRRARHRLSFMSGVIRTMNRHLRKMPADSDYLNLLVRPRIAAAVVAGKNATPYLVHVCQTCHQGFYSMSPGNERTNHCPECE